MSSSSPDSNTTLPQSTMDKLKFATESVLSITKSISLFNDSLESILAYKPAVDNVTKSLCTHFGASLLHDSSFLIVGVFVGEVAFTKNQPAKTQE